MNAFVAAFLRQQHSNKRALTRQRVCSQRQTQTVSIRKPH